MGADIHIKVVKFNHETRYYDELQLFTRNNKGEYFPVDIFPGRNSEMFGAMQNQEVDNYGRFPATPLKLDSLSPSLREEMKAEMDYSDTYSFNEIGVEAFRNYVKEHKKIYNYDLVWDELGYDAKATEIKNPLKDMYKDIQAYIFFATGWWENNYSDYKMIFWFDW